MAESLPLLSCSVCLEEFKQPKVLSCGHTFCTSCIKKIVGEGRRRNVSLKCPTCRKGFDLPMSGNVEDLPTNYELLNITEGRIHSRRGSSSSSRRSKRPPRQPECLTHNCMSKEFYCKTCNLGVCAKCLLDKHKPECHEITTKGDFVHSVLNKLNHLGQMYHDVQGRQHDIDVRVLAGMATCQQEKERLEGQIESTRLREIERIQNEAEKLLHKVRRETVSRKDTLAGVKVTNGKMQVMARDRKSTIDSIREEVHSGNFTNLQEIQQIGEDLMILLCSCDNMEETVRSTPTTLQLEIQYK